MKRSAPISRRAVLAGAAALAATPAGAAPARTVVMVGDSITTGYGLPAHQALPAALQGRLARLGLDVRVRTIAAAGDTSARGLARLRRTGAPDADAYVVALGGNDLLGGIPPARTRASLDAILAELKRRDAPLVLAGLKAPPIVDPAWRRAFDGLFPALAARHGALLYPDLLAGVAMRAALNQPDRIHPNAAGVRVIAAGLAPVVAKALRAA